MISRHTTNWKVTEAGVTYIRVGPMDTKECVLKDGKVYVNNTVYDSIEEAYTKENEKYDELKKGK